MTPVNAAPTAAFAYLRRLPAMGEESVHQVLKELVAYTERQGLALAGVFYEERIEDRLEVWCRLVAACRSENVTSVVVPSGEHLHPAPESAAFLRAELATAVRGTVWIAEAAEVAPPPARPRLYGYFRVLDGMDAAAVLNARRTLAEFAEQGGFELVDIYEDGGPGHRLQVWLDMVESCRSEDVPALVALSLDTFHPTPELAAFMRDELAERIRGTVLIATMTPGEPTHDG